MKILAVDDDPVFLSVLVPMLNAVGEKDVTVAVSAKDALAELKRAAQDFDCILLDIQMPGMNGVELCQHVRSLPAYRRTPIVMVTSMNDRRSIDDAFTVGATDYITKPLERVDLSARIGMVDRLLNERRLFAALERQLDQRTDVVTMSVDFETAIPIPGFERGIEYLALENYLLTLGNKRMHSTAAIGISVQNAGAFFRKATVASYVNMLGDVASAISDAVKTDQMLISYAGSGNFVCVVESNPASDSGDLEQMIQAGVADFTSFYAMDNLPQPLINVGPLVRTSFFGLFKPTSILDRAIALAETGQATQIAKVKSWWSAA
jgi:CheY-like chemotaxis protein